MITLKNISGSALQQEEEKILEILSTVTDPEVPVLTILDLGIVRQINVTPTDVSTVEIVITPTYSGCPAMDVIGMNIRLALLEKGYKNITITQVLSPAWTTDWMTTSGKEKLKAYGIAPPQGQSSRIEKLLFEEDKNIECPLCNSINTRLISQFGSTACKALYQCNDCKEPFDYFKCH
ncbi:MAG: 1,2-phenylacetyl-CoA epoxidase subunit PaaD [Ferruginibacter sp.]